MSDLSEISTVIPAYACDIVEANIAKLAKRARKLGVTPPSVEFSNFREEKRRDFGLKSDFQIMCDMTLRYEEIKLSGDWTLLASVEKEELGNVVYSASGKDFTHLRTATLNCDHCNHKRVRKVHYVVGNAAGEEKVVGSTCLKDFLGVDPKKALTYFAAIHDFMDDDEYRQPGQGKPWIAIESLAAWVARDVELVGRFISCKMSYESNGDLSSTSSNVINNISLQNDSRVEEETKAMVRPTDNNTKTAALVMTYLNKSLETVEKVGVEHASDWDYKIANFLKRGYTSMYGKDYNIIVGAIGAALRKIDAEKEREAEEGNPVGLEDVDTLLNANPKSHVEFTGKVIKVSETENMFSYYAPNSTMVILKLGNKEKNVKVRFFTTKDLGVSEGDVVKMSVKVKRIDVHPRYGTTVQANYPKVL